MNMDAKCDRSPIPEYPAKQKMNETQEIIRRILQSCSSSKQKGQIDVPSSRNKFILPDFKGCRRVSQATDSIFLVRHVKVFLTEEWTMTTIGNGQITKRLRTKEGVVNVHELNAITAWKTTCSYN